MVKMTAGVRRWLHAAVVSNSSAVDECSLNATMRSARTVKDMLRRSRDLLRSLKHMASSEYGRLDLRFVVLFMFPETPTIVLWNDSLWSRLCNTRPILLMMRVPDAFYEHFPEEYFRMVDISLQEHSGIECSFRSYRTQLSPEEDYASGVYLTTRAT